MTKPFSVVSGLAIAMIVAASSASSATLDGASFRVDYLKPDTATIYPNTNGPIFGVAGAPGTDAEILVENVTTIMLDFSSLTLELYIATTLVDPVFDADTFNGIRVTFTNLPYVINKFDLFGQSANLDVTPSFTAKELFINWSGSAYNEGDTLSFDIGLAPVPLPAALPMFLAGLGAMGVIGLRRARKASV